jgi:hypothetical protein
MDKKPPDKNTSIKCLLHDIVRSPKLCSILDDACFRVHQLIIHNYQFIRLWILHKYHLKLDLPTLTEATFTTGFVALKLQEPSKRSVGASNLGLFQEFRQFIQTDYQSLNYNSQISGNNLTSPLNYAAKEMLTAVETNIKLNLTKYINRFVDLCFGDQPISQQHDGVSSKIQKGKQKQAFKRKHKTEADIQLKKDRSAIKNDLINQTLKSPSKYHHEILKHRQLIFPKDVINYQDDVNVHPQSYLKGMIYMSLAIEKANPKNKTFQFFPLRTDAVMKSVLIDSRGLRELAFTDPQTKKLYANLTLTKAQMWKRLFKFNHSKFRLPNYSFDYQIKTDGYTASVLFIHHDHREKHEQSKVKRQQAKKAGHAQTKGLTPMAKQAHQLVLKTQKDAKVSERLKLTQQHRIKLQAQIASYTKADRDLYFKQLKKSKKEFLHLEDLTDVQFQRLKTSRWCVIDPGLRDLLHIKGEGVAFGPQERALAKKKAIAKKSGTTAQLTALDQRLEQSPENSIKTVSYSSKQYLKETKRLKYQRLIQNYRTKMGITKVEMQLNDCKQRTCQLDTFKQYISIKNQVNLTLLDTYKNEIFRQYQWYGFINRKKAEEKLIRTIKITYGKDVVLCYGDYDKGECPLKYISVPGIGLKRTLAKHFTIYDVNEFRTSVLHHKSEERCGNLHIEGQKLHAVLTFTTSSGRQGCLNRDENATFNMLTIVRQFLTDRSRPLRFCRGIQVLQVQPVLTVESLLEPKMKLTLKLLQQSCEEQLILNRVAIRPEKLKLQLKNTILNPNNKLASIEIKPVVNYEERY